MEIKKGFSMWLYFLSAFKEIQININAIPMNIWENELNLSNGRITDNFSKWLVETHLKLAKTVKVEKDRKVEGQFLVKNHGGKLIYIVRDFIIAEHAQPGDFLKAEKLIIDKKCA